MILVVDDSASRRYAYARVIAQSGYTVKEASTGREGLALASDADAILLDVHLPDLDGFQVCRMIRSEPRTARLPVIHVSAVFVLDVDVQEGRGAGANAYLIDPVPPAVLIQVLDTTLAAAREQS